MLSRELIVDASGIINLLNGGVARTCLQNIEPVVDVTPAIERECNGHGDTSLAFRGLVDDGLLVQCLAVISATDLAEFIELNDLGAGESEAILACEQIGRHVWCDDGRARTVARERLGIDKVTGTLGILKDLVRIQDLTPELAHSSYQAMIAAGGFLPSMTLQDFMPAEA